MGALLKSRLTLPALLIAVLFLIAARGSDPTVTPRPDPTQPPLTEAPAASDAEAMESEEGMAEDGEAMEDDKMAEDGDGMAMESDSIALKLTGIQPLATGTTMRVERSSMVRRLLPANSTLPPMGDWSRSLVRRYPMACSNRQWTSKEQLPL